MTDSVDLATRFAVGLQWACTFAVTFCASCAMIFAVDRYRHRAGNAANSEYNAYDAPMRKKILKTVAWNLLFSVPVFGVAQSLVMPWWRMHWQPDLPLYISMPLFAILSDLCFFLLHRAAHWPPIYRHVHKKHHEINVAFAPGAIYCTTLEMWFVNMLADVSARFKRQRDLVSYNGGRNRHNVGAQSLLQFSFSTPSIHRNRFWKFFIACRPRVAHVYRRRAKKKENPCAMARRSASERHNGAKIKKSFIVRKKTETKIGKKRWWKKQLCSERCRPNQLRRDTCRTRPFSV